MTSLLCDVALDDAVTAALSNASDVGLLLWPSRHACTGRQQQQDIRALHQGSMSGSSG